MYTTTVRTSLVGLGLSCLLGGAAAGQRSVTPLRGTTSGPTVTGIDLQTLEVHPGSSIQFKVLGSGLSLASALRFYVGTHQLNDPAIQAQILSPGNTQVTVKIVAGPSANTGKTYALKLAVGHDEIALPKSLAVVPVPAASVTSAQPASLQVPLGGTAAVVLSGSHLDLLNSAVVKLTGGGPANGITATLEPTSANGSRKVEITSTQIPSVPIGAPLALLVSGPPPTTTTQVQLQLSLTGNAVRVHEDDLFGPINTALAAASTSFVSCGPTAGVRRLKLNNVAGYQSDVAVPRFEYAVTTAERLIFLEQHSLDPTDAFSPQDFLSLPKNAHPSPVPHSVSSVRLCVVPTMSAGNWKVTGVHPQGSEVEVVVSVKYPKVLFRARAMPVHHLLQIEALAVGIGWGNVITDAELPDLEYTSPQIDARLRFTASGGVIKYSSVQTSLKYSKRWWSSVFLGPNSVESKMEQHAQARMQQLESEIGKALSSSPVRAAITTGIKSRLASTHSVPTVVALTHVSGDMWEVVYP
ncbi:MAG: hypothetical protein AB7R55_16615 [Gemmatimonadales bacterium]